MSDSNAEQDTGIRATLEKFEECAKLDALQDVTEHVFLRLRNQQLLLRDILDRAILAAQSDVQQQLDAILDQRLQASRQFFVQLSSLIPELASLDRTLDRMLMNLQIMEQLEAAKNGTSSSLDSLDRDVSSDSENF